MNAHLTPVLEQAVPNKVHLGRYTSASEVAREALRLTAEHGQLKPLCREEIQIKIDESLESLRLGEGIDGETLFAEFEAELDELERTGHR